MVKKFGELFENVQLSKSILKKLGKTTEDEDYQIIRGMLEKKQGWVGLFTKFRFEQNVSVDDLAQLLDRLNEMQALLGRLSTTVDKYEDYEKLVDDLDTLEASHRSNKLLKELNKEQQQWVRLTGDAGMKRLEELAGQFYKLTPNVQREFTRKLKTEFGRGTGAQAGETFLNKLETYIEAQTTGWYAENIKTQVDNTGSADVVYEDAEKGYLIVELKTYQAAQALCSATRWCFRNSPTLWESYVGYEKMTRQYSIYNFNVKLSDVHSMLGVTIGEGEDPDDWTQRIPNAIRHAHWKDDSNASEEGKNPLKKYYGEDWAALAKHLLGVDEKEAALRKKCFEITRKLEDWCNNYRESEEEAAERKRKVEALFPSMYHQLITNFKGRYSAGFPMRVAIKYDLPDMLDEIMAKEPLLQGEDFDQKSLTVTSMKFCILEKALTAKADKILKKLFKRPDLTYDLTTADLVLDYYKRTKQYNKIIEMRPRYSGGLEHNITYALVHSADPGVYKHLLTANEYITQTNLVAMADKYFDEMKPSEELFDLFRLPFTKHSYTNEHFTFPMLLARCCDDDALFLREFERVKDTVLDDNEATMTARLVHMRRFDDAAAVLGRFKQRYPESSRNTSNYQAKHIRELVLKLINALDYDGTVGLLERNMLSVAAICDCEEFYLGFLVILVKKVDWNKATLTSNDLKVAVEKTIYTTRDEKSLKLLVKTLRPFKTKMKLEDAGLYALLLFTEKLDEKPLLDYLQLTPNTTFDKQRDELRLEYDDFDNEDFEELYDKGNPLNSEEHFAHIPRYEHDFDSEWSLISEENHARIDDILRRRGWQVTSPTSSLTILRKFEPAQPDEDDHDYDDFEDEDEYDEDEEVLRESFGNGEDCSDLVEVIHDVVIKALEHDTTTANFQAAMDTLSGILRFGDNIFQPNDAGVRKVVAYLAVDYLRDNFELDYVYNVFRTYESNQKFNAMQLVSTILHETDKVLDGDKPDEQPTCTPETLNELLDEALQDFMEKEGL